MNKTRHSVTPLKVILVVVSLAIILIVTVIVMTFNNFSNNSKREEAIVKSAAQSVNLGSDFQYQDTNCTYAELSVLCHATYVTAMPGTNDDIVKTVESALSAAGYDFKSQYVNSWYLAVNTANQTAYRDLDISELSGDNTSPPMKQVIVTYTHATIPK